MKLKLSILFLILSGAFVYFVFKGSYFSLNTKTEEPAQQGESTSAALLSRLISADLRDYSGNKFLINSELLQKSNIIVIHLWASWCNPCVNEVPELMEYSKKNPDIKFVIISLDEDKNDIAKFLQSFPEFNSDKYIKIWDVPNGLSQVFNADRLPMSVVIRKNNDKPQFIKSVVDWKSLRL